MSIVSRVFRPAWHTKSTAFLKVARHTGFNIKQPRFSRAFHQGHAKRPGVSKASTKWGVFDELKLFSYTSHLAFFMLLPPIIQMYTTKVEVTRDETMTESSFATLEMGQGVTIKHMNFLDILQSEKNKLMDQYLQSEAAGNTEQSSEDARHFIASSNRPAIKENALADAPGKIRELKSQPDTTEDEELRSQLDMIDDVYSSLQRHLISDHQYMSAVEKITDQLLAVGQRRNTKHADKELANNTIMRIFDQLHSLRMHAFESELFRRLITSYTCPEARFLNIKHAIVTKYETSKAANNAHAHMHTRNGKRQVANTGLPKKNARLPLPLSLHELMEVSVWLRSYVSSFERFAQLVQMFAATGQTKKALHALFHIGFDSPEVRKQVQNPGQRYGLVGALRSLHRESEALALERKMRKLM